MRLCINYQIADRNNFRLGRKFLVGKSTSKIISNKSFFLHKQSDSGKLVGKIYLLLVVIIAYQMPLLTHGL